MCLRSAGMAVLVLGIAATLCHAQDKAPQLEKLTDKIKELEKARDQLGDRVKELEKARDEEARLRRLERSDLNRQIVKVVFETATVGTEIFNKKNYEGCFRLYQGSLMSVQPLLPDSKPNLIKSVKVKLEQAKTQKPEEGAVTLRSALDEIMNEIGAQTKDEKSVPGTGAEKKSSSSSK